MSDGFKIQLNVKVGEELINLRADSPAEAESLFNWAFEKADAIAKTISTLKGTQAVAQGLGGQTVSVQTQPQGSWSTQGSQQQYQNQQPAGPQGAPAQGGGAPPPTKWDLSGPPTAPEQCIHGQMQWKHRVAKGSGKEYRGWFCTKPKEQGGCDAKFLR